jgi:predicted ArsR family transcriptional regulator
MESFLTEKHHALLFGLLARNVMNAVGEAAGEAIVREAVRRYGEQRGRRMRLRALRDGAPLNLTSYLAYKEWRPATSEACGKTVEQAGDVISTVSACPWANAWQETGLLPYGRFYCQEIDLALGRGFDPEAVLEVQRTLTNDREPCEFVFRGAVIPGTSELPVVDPSMPWDYHCAHLYKTMSELLGERVGKEGLRVARAALDEFAQTVGEAMVRQIVDWQKSDFNQLP